MSGVANVLRWAATALVLALALLPPSPLHAAYEASYVPGTTGALNLSLANYPVGSLDHGPIDRQLPLAVETVLSMSATINTQNDIDCGTGEVETVLAAANRPAAEGTVLEPSACLFAIRLTLRGPTLAREIVAGCSEWQDDISYCWFEGDAGQLWVRRRSPAGERLELVLGPFDETVGLGSPRAGTVSDDGMYNGVPANGILIEQGEPELGEAASDLWLIWPAGISVIELER